MFRNWFHSFVITAAAVAASSGLSAQVDESAIKDVNAFTATTPSEVRGAGASWSGTNVGGFSFDRALSDCNSISGLGPVLGSAQPFFVSATGAYDFTSTQDYDGYIHIYQAPFDPSDPLANCVIGDDDGNGGIGTSDIVGVTLQAGVPYIAVTSAFAAGDEGTFNNTISGAGTVTLGSVPESIPVPATSVFGKAALLLMLGLTAALVLSRRIS